LYQYGIQQGAVYKGPTLALKGHSIAGDDLFPALALHYMPQYVSIIFIIGLISALFPSADGALTALTSSFCIDLLDLKNRPGYDEKRLRRTRMTVHLSFAMLFLLCIMVFKLVNKSSIIYTILGLAGYTYGPLLGLFAFGIFTKRELPNTGKITIVCLLAPVICYFLAEYSAHWLGGFRIGLELLLINGILTFLGLWALSRRQPSV